MTLPKPSIPVRVESVKPLVAPLPAVSPAEPRPQRDEPPATAATGSPGCCAATREHDHVPAVMLPGQVLLVLSVAAMAQYATLFPIEARRRFGQSGAR